MRECVKLKHTYARDIGAEWVCLLAIREVEIDRLLRREGWSDIQINTTLVHLITCTKDTPSEMSGLCRATETKVGLPTMRIISTND